jgi:hypothetical protein
MRLFYFFMIFDTEGLVLTKPSSHVLPLYYLLTPGQQSTSENGCTYKLCATGQR